MVTDEDYGKIVSEGTIKIGYSIRKYGDQYDWIANSGEDSDELFDSAADAENDVFSRFS